MLNVIAKLKPGEIFGIEYVAKVQISHADC